jgi:predicted nucleotidyltransferase
MQSTSKKINKAAAIKIAKQYVELCRELNLQIKKAFLFGSFAKGTASNDSDIDLLLVSDQFIPNSLENWKMLAPITAKLYQVEPHPYPTKNYDKGDPFLAEIKKDSIEIRVN